MSEKQRKGILLAGGTGSRLYPSTLAVNKQLLTVYDKPMIYYPLSVLMLAGIREVLIICREQDLTAYKILFEDSQKRFGITIEYAVQEAPNGIAEAFLIGKDFLDGAPSMLALGDNIFFGHGLTQMLYKANIKESGATIFGYWVKNPESFGVIKFNENLEILDLVEKPKTYVSSYAIPGLYFYDESAPARAAALTPSARGELEITDLNKSYFEDGLLDAIRLPRGFAWLDTGTADSLLDAANYIATIERRQGLKIACLEEIAWRQGWISEAALKSQADSLKSDYGRYLDTMLELGK